MSVGFDSETDWRKLRCERRAGVDDPPVPRDRLLDGRFRFPAPSLGDVRRAFDLAHAFSDILYLGDGRCDTPGDYPTEVKHTSGRVLGYIPAWRALGEPVYRERALEGLEYLLRIRPQGEASGFPWFDHSHDGVHSHGEGVLETAMAGRALVDGFELTGDPRCLEASREIAEREAEHPVGLGRARSMAAVWHLARHYEVTRDEDALEAAVTRTREGGMQGQLASGGWPGEDSWIWNHGMITGGMAQLLRVLPEDHAFRPELAASVTAALNRTIREQAASGEIPPNLRFKYRGNTCANILSAMLVARESLGHSLDNCIHGVVQYRLARAPDGEFVNRYRSAWRGYASARQAARDAATGEVVWRAEFDRFFKDAEWGLVASGACECWYPGSEPDPELVRWERVTSERTGANAQRIVSHRGGFRGGMGWVIEAGRLTPGRRYRFTAWTNCAGADMVVCSAFSGRRRQAWDAFTDCEFTREDPARSGYSPVWVSFDAVGEDAYVYAWVVGETGEQVSIAVDEAIITDDGLPLPRWDQTLDALELNRHMVLLPTGAYLEAAFGRTDSA